EAKIHCRSTRHGKAWGHWAPSKNGSVMSTVSEG
ncbi:uncharacterized protein WCI35_026207, partial [Daubentonia madagascariensis]